LPIARAKAEEFFKTKMGGRDQFACGFAWTVVYDVKLNTKQGKEFAKAGFRKEYGGGISLWNPADMPIQNVETKEVGARAFAQYLNSLGFKAYGNSRLD
jgi:hypothetical protein